MGDFVGVFQQPHDQGGAALAGEEWAADQDPTFRRIFYSEILPDLKRQGKTLIVISHDNRYFSAADRYIRLGKRPHRRRSAARARVGSRTAAVQCVVMHRVRPRLRPQSRWRRRINPRPTATPL
jgi:hypothetical protein